MVYYRAYRPQKFADLAGQPQVDLLLKNLEAGKVSHAYLFTGPRGSGKTTTARLLAKSLNCKKYDKNVYGEVCGVCDSCRAIADGTFVDLIEIDAASNRGIDEIRDLREKAHLATSLGRYKVYIIDEVHMLTNEAFNALLKILEEPPTHVVFILATTELQKIPATVLSRTQKFEFKKASIEELLAYLQKIAKAEKLKASDEALKLLATEADGSFRDAAKLLEQISGEEVTLESVQNLLGAYPSHVYQDLLQGILKKDEKEVLRIVDSLNQGNINPKSLSTSLINLINTLLLSKTGLVKSVDKEIDSWFKTLPEVTTGRLSELADLLLNSLTQIPHSPIPFLPLQIAALKFIASATNSFIGPEEKKKSVTLEIPAETPDVVEENPVITDPVDVVDPVEPPIEEVIINPEPETKAVPVESTGRASLTTLWVDVLKSIKPKAISLEALLRTAEPLEIKDDNITIKFFYSFHKEKANEPRNYALLVDSIKEVYGSPIKVKFVMGERAPKPKGEIIEELKNITPINDDNLLSAANDIFSADIN